MTSGTVPDGVRHKKNAPASRGVFVADRGRNQPVLSVSPYAVSVGLIGWK